jgi:hypothetical protein
MSEDAKQSDGLSGEVQDIMRGLITAIRAVKLYPPNNPIYSQSVKKSCELLAPYLEKAHALSVGVQKTAFTAQQLPFAKDTQQNKTIAQDLFMKGVREMVFSSGVTEAELLELYRALARSSESLAMSNGIASVLWEKDVKHVKVVEAGLDEVITSSAGERERQARHDADADSASDLARHEFRGRTLVLTDLDANPEAYSARMLELAMETRGENETVEDRLYSLYRDAGREIEAERGTDRAQLLEKLARSVLSLDPPYREGLIAGKLYADRDSDAAQEGIDEENLPAALHELESGRFSDSWSVQQIASLLKRSAEKTVAVSAPPATPADVEAAPLTAEIFEDVKHLAEYSPEEMASLRQLSESGMEADILGAAMRTLIFLLPRVKNSARPADAEQELALFSGVVRQLEEMAVYLLNNREYKSASHIIEAFHVPVDPAFKPRMIEAQRKTASRVAIMAAIKDLRTQRRESAEYAAAYEYLSALERETTEALLELLAEGDDRTARIFYLDLIKVIGKNQTALFGDRLSDSRWYFVRNIVSILGENKSDQSLALLRKAADHENVRIRQEVIKSLMSIGGKKAASVLAKFLRDKDEDVLVMALRAFADFSGIGAEETHPIISFLEERQLRKKDMAVIVESIRALGKIGGPGAREFLGSYARIIWWKPRKLQRERQEEAMLAREEITRRLGDGQRTAR